LEFVRGGNPPKRRALSGYLFANADAPVDELSSLRTLFLGGDTRYGLGRVCRIAWEAVDQVFAAEFDGDGESPAVKIRRLLAHGADQSDAMIGSVELLSGWDRGKSGTELRSIHSEPMWTPGSTAGDDLWWSVGRDGLWRTRGAQTVSP
jgi:hypothetical protein